MNAKEFLKSKGINYDHEATGMCAYVQNAGSTINAMEKLLDEYCELRLSNVVGQSEQLVCECGNKLTDKEIYFGQCLQCDKNIEEAN